MVVVHVAGVIIIADFLFHFFDLFYTWSKQTIAETAAAAASLLLYIRKTRCYYSQSVSMIRSSYFIK